MRRDGLDRPVVVVVVDDGMLAMMSNTASGDTPSAPGVQPAREKRDATAIAPIRGSGGVTMPRAKAVSAPRVY